jgi:hypothetical protein
VFGRLYHLHPFTGDAKKGPPPSTLSSAKNKRRTSTLFNTCQPQWNQSFIFQPVQPHALSTHYLEVTVWDNDRLGANEFLGEVCVDLAVNCGQSGVAVTEEMHQAVWHALDTSGFAPVSCDNSQTDLDSPIQKVFEEFSLFI